jgi:hypothetical protein
MLARQWNTESIHEPVRLLLLRKSVMKIMWVLVKKVVVPKDTETSLKMFCGAYFIYFMLKRLI